MIYGIVHRLPVVNFVQRNPSLMLKCSIGLIFMQSACLDNKAAIMNC